MFLCGSGELRKKGLIGMRFRQEGFTLIEVLVAMVVAAIVLASMLGLQASAIRMRAHARLSSAALNTARDFLDQVMASAPHEFQLNNQAILDSGFVPMAVVLPSGAVLARRWDIQRDSPLAGLFTVRVMICWRESRKPAPDETNCDFDNRAAPHVLLQVVAGR